MLKMKYEDLPALGNIRDFSKLEEDVRVIMDVEPKEYAHIIAHVIQVAVSRNLSFCTAQKHHMELWFTQVRLA